MPTRTMFSVDGDRGISEDSALQPALLLPLWAGPSFSSFLGLSLFSAGYLAMRVFFRPQGGSQSWVSCGHKPCLYSNTLWIVQLEPSIPLLELSSQESHPGPALFPRHCSILAQGLLCFNSKSIGCYLHLPSSVPHH